MFLVCVCVRRDFLYFDFCSINGVPACANAKLLTDITRTEWGFEGYVVSDQGAIGGQEEGL